MIFFTTVALIALLAPTAMAQASYANGSDLGEPRALLTLFLSQPTDARLLYRRLSLR
jgi:hypothetical protein